MLDDNIKDGWNILTVNLYPTLLGSTSAEAYLIPESSCASATTYGSVGNIANNLLLLSTSAQPTFFCLGDQLSANKLGQVSP